MGLMRIPITFHFRNECWINNSVPQGFLYPCSILPSNNWYQFSSIHQSILKFRKNLYFFHWNYYIKFSINWKNVSNETFDKWCLKRDIVGTFHAFSKALIASVHNDHIVVEKHWLIQDSFLSHPVNYLSIICPLHISVKC